MKLTCTTAVAAVMGGCAAHNYDFSSLGDDTKRVSHLIGGLESVSGDGEAGDDALYDVSLTPLVHSRLHVFAEADEDDEDASYIEADLASYLPVFGFATGTVSRYDSDQRLLDKHVFDSGFWGAFRNHREITMSDDGTRERTRHTFLWIFNWSSEEQFYPATAMSDRSDSTR